MIEAFAIRIFQGLKPDVVAIQKFNYCNNTSTQIRAFVDTAFGTNFHYTQTNSVELPRPQWVQSKTNYFRWQAVPGMAYTVESCNTLTNWIVAAQTTATATNLIFTNLLSTDACRFYRVSY